MSGPPVALPLPDASRDSPLAGASVLAVLGPRQVALPLAALVEVAEVAEVAALPLAPRWLLGVTNLRGGAVPVVDLAALAGWEPAPPGGLALVLRDGRYRLALPVDAVVAVRAVDLGGATPLGEGKAADDVIATHELTLEGRRTWVISADAVLAQVRHGGPVGTPGGHERGGGA